MPIQLDAHELEAEAARDKGAAATLLAGAKKVLKKVSFDAERSWKRQQPVLTGRSRASIGHWTDSITQGRERLKGGGIPAGAARNAMEASDLDSIYEESADGLTITFGSNLEYMEALNAGHSLQAPAGFIDVISEQAAVTLDNALAQLADML